MPFIATTAILAEQEALKLDQDVPDHYEWNTNTLKSLYGFCLNLGYVVRDLGAPIVIVGSEGDRDAKIVVPRKQVAVYQLAGCTTLTYLDRQLNANPEQPGYNLLKQGGDFSSGTLLRSW